MAKKEYDFRGKLFHVDPSWQRSLMRLDDMERLKIWDAIMSYRMDGVEVSLTGEISEKAEGVYWVILDTLSRYDDNARTISDKRRVSVSSRYEDNKEEPTNSTSATNVDFVEDVTKPTTPTNRTTIPYHTNPNHTIPSNNIEKSTTSSSNANAPDVVDVRRGQKELAREIASYYNEQIEAKGARLRKCERINKEREGWILARINEFGEEKVKLGIDKAIASRGLNYDMNIAPVDISWIMRPRNFPEILEGKYDNKQQHHNTVPSAHFANEGDRSKWANEKEKWEQ